MKYKKIIIPLAAACMILTACTASIPDETISRTDCDDNEYTSEWSGDSESSGSDSTSEWTLENAEDDTVLAAPEITECRYIHQIYYTPDCLCVGWSVVEGAAKYEMELCESDCTVIKTYTTTSTRKAIDANRGDNAVTGCVKGCKIRVRAIDADGNPGNWSDYDTVGCNSLWDKIGTE